MHMEVKKINFMSIPSCVTQTWQHSIIPKILPSVQIDEDEVVLGYSLKQITQESHRLCVALVIFLIALLLTSQVIGSFSLIDMAAPVVFSLITTVAVCRFSYVSNAKRIEEYRILFSDIKYSKKNQEFIVNGSKIKDGIDIEMYIFKYVPQGKIKGTSFVSVVLVDRRKKNYYPIINWCYGVWMAKRMVIKLASASKSNCFIYFIDHKLKTHELPSRLSKPLDARLESSPP